MEGVLEALEDRIHQRKLRPFPKLHLGIFGLDMQILHPVVVGSSSVSGDILFEHN